MAADKSSAKNFDFKIISHWQGYNSANDKTNLAEDIYVGGSLNMYKKINGNIANRAGLKRIGLADSTVSPVSSEFVWNTSWGATLPVWVTNNTLQVSINDIWHTLEVTTATRYVFDKWWDNERQKDRLIFVHGNSDLQEWSGGVATFDSGNNSGGIISGLDATPTNGGTGYTLNDILTITGGGGSGGTAKVTALTNGTILTLGSLDTTTNPNLTYAVNDVVSIIGGSGGTILITGVSGGAITSFSLNTGGTGYIAGGIYVIANGSVASPTNGPNYLTVSTVGTNGVASVDLVNPGTGYSTGSGAATTGGTGTGATLNITGITNNSIIIQGSVSPFLLGFDTNGSLDINGVTYTYTGLSGNGFVGVTPDPSGAGVAGDFLAQTIITYANTPSSGFNNDFIKVINNQVYVGSYTSRLCYISANDDFTNYVVPTPRLPGSPELLTLDSTLNGIGVRQGNAYISFGTGEWASITFNNITVGSTLTQQTKVDVKPVAKLAAAYAHEFIGNDGDNIVYLSKDQQVRTLGDFNNSFVSAYPSLSQQISTELMAENFSGGGIKCIADFTYVTAPASGKTYLYQVRQSVDANNQVVVERLWHSPFTWNATRVDEINGTVVSFSNSNPQYYQVWDTNQYFDDSPSDEPLPYSCVLAQAYKTSGRRQGLVSFDKVFSEGYIDVGTPLNLTVNYNYLGATAQVVVPINSNDQPAYIFGSGSSSSDSNSSSLGDSSLGDKPLGEDDSETSVSELPKFKVIRSLALVNCFEYQLIYSTDDVNAQWELLANGTNAKVESEQEATFIINKLH